MRARLQLLTGVVLPLASLAGCGGDSGGVVSTPAPAPAAVVPTPPPPPPPPAVNYDTAEYRRSNAAVQAQALAAYNAGATGNGIIVGVIDSGVDSTSAEFSGRISPLSADLAGSRGVGDEGGHGTAVSDVLLGAKNDTGIQGVAFNATLLALRTDTPGSCTSSSGTTGSGGCSHSDNNIAAALDLAVTAHARVVNISLGGTPPNTRLRGAIDRATTAGIIIVISAGNDGVDNPSAAVNPDTFAQIANDPVAHGLVIIAGAADSTGALADFSNKAGNSAANYITALGVRVRAIDNTGASFLYSGTSFSAPTVSGAVALLAQAFPTLTAAQIVSLLYRTADDRGATGVDTTYGNGELNIARAFSPVGSLSVAGSAVPVSLAGNATLGGAMGDAGKGGLGAVIRDEYGRDFDVDLSHTVMRTPPQQTLSGGLAIATRNVSAASGRAFFSLAVDAQGQDRPLLLSSADAERARVLAGAMAVAAGKHLMLGFGAGRDANGLVTPPALRGAPAFLVTDNSLAREPLAAFAARRALGGIGLTLTAESGEMRLWERRDLLAGRVQRYAYSQLSAGVDAARGPLALSASLTRLDERATVLGGRFDAALGGNGAVSWFANLEAQLTPLSHWRLGAQLRRGWTMLNAQGLRGRSQIGSLAFSGMVTRDSLWVAGDSLSLRYAQPLRVTSGGVDLRYPGLDAQLLSLAPSGRERDWEAVYARPTGPGWLTANAYLRQQPGHYASAPDDIGVALRYGFRF